MSAPCRTCRFFEPSPSSAFSHLGFCTIVLPQWVVDDGERLVRVDASCDLHREPEPPDMTSDDYTAAYGWEGQG